MNKIAILAACVFAAGTMSAVDTNASAPATELFSKDALHTVKGTVKDVKHVDGEMEGVHAVLDVDGKLVVVLLGPAAYLEELKFAPKAGDVWEVTGFKVEAGKDHQVVAKSVKFNDKEFKFRDDAGAQVWKADTMKK